MLIAIFVDLSARDDVSGWDQTLWVIFVVVVPYIGVLAYIISQRRGIVTRKAELAQGKRHEHRTDVGFQKVA